MAIKHRFSSSASLNERLQAELSRPHILEVGAHATPSDLESYVNQIGIEDRRAASAYVFRILRTQLDSLRDKTSQRALNELVRKASTVPMFALCLDGRHQLYRVEAAGISPLPDDAERSALHHLCAIDLRRVVDDGDGTCFFRALPSQHFVAPSGEHCEAFFRLGDAIRSKRALDRLVFWTTPVIASAGGVIVDNWSIASLAFRVLQLAKKDTPFDCLASHPMRDRRDAERIISRMIKEDLASDSTLVFLISVTSSGSYAETVLEIAGRHLSEDRIKVIAIYGLAGTLESVDRLCTLDFNPRNFQPEACPLCASGSTPISFDPGLYYLKVYPERQVTLGREHFAHRTFIDRYHSVPDAFTVHRDDRFKRHHAFHVNVGAMLSNSAEFKQRCLTALEGLRGSVEILFTPANDVSQLGQLAAQHLGLPRIAADSVRDITEAEADLLKHKRRVLIVDDVLVSGSRIEGYVRAFREQADPPQAVKILVGLGRTTSQEALQQHRTAWTKNLPWDAQLILVEEFFLPDWEAAECPWCHEFEFLSKAAEGIAAPPLWLTNRIGRLVEREQGAGDENPLLLLPGVPSRKLGHGSLAGPEGMSAMATLFSIASALQQLRNDARSERKLDADFPLHQVLAVKNLRNYSETLLRAIFLRVVAPREWGVSEKQDFKELLVEICRRGEDDDLIAGEMLLATSRGPLDRSVLITLGPILETRRPGSEALLRALSGSDARDERLAIVERDAGKPVPESRSSVGVLAVLLVLLVVAGVAVLWLER